MPADIWYGADCECRIGRRTSVATPPTAWQSIDFVSFNANPAQEWRDRPRIGVAGVRQNTLDPIKPRKGLFRLTAELVVDLDNLSTPLWLRHAMGAPVTTSASSLFNHQFASGSKAEQYFDLAIRVGTADFRIYEGLTLSQLSLQVNGENVQDYNLNLSLRGLTRSRLSAWPTGTVTAAVAASPNLRATFVIDAVAASNMLTASFSFDRQLREDLYLTSTPAVSGNAPNGGAHTGSATFRAIGTVFESMEEAETVFSPSISFVGVDSTFGCYFQHKQALLTPSPLPISGPGVIERTLNWTAHQVPSAPAAVIVFINNVASYA